MPHGCSRKNLPASSRALTSRSARPPIPISRWSASSASLAPCSKSLRAKAAFDWGIVTKSALIMRDRDLLQEIARRNHLSIHLTVTTVDTELARTLEPRAPRPDLRMKTVAALRQAGLRTGVLCSPLMPGITDSRSSIGGPLPRPLPRRMQAFSLRERCF